MVNKKKLKFLRSLAHDCKPVVWIGQHGLTDKVIEEINTALDHHELIKIKVRVGDREQREKVTDDICRKTHTELIRIIGNTVTVFRRNDETPVIQFSNNK